MNTQTSRLLVVAAHPDDEVLGCGGTVAAMRDQDVDVTVLILGEGITSRGLDAETTRRELAQLREGSRRACGGLGVDCLAFADLPDNRFDSLPLLEIVKVVEAQVNAFGPDTVLTHHGGDLNVDHQQAFRAVLTAVRPMAGRVVRRLYCFETPSSTEWAFGRLQSAFQPQVFVDISTTLDRKIEAMAAYEGESRPFPHPRSGRALRAIAERWGSVAGLEAAEAFETIFDIR